MDGAEFFGRLLTVNLAQPNQHKLGGNKPIWSSDECTLAFLHYVNWARALVGFLEHWSTVRLIEFCGTLLMTLLKTLL